MAAAIIVPSPSTSDMREGGKYVSMEEDDPCPPPTMRVVVVVVGS